MNKFFIIAILLGLSASSLAQAGSTVKTSDGGFITVTLSSKGLDVRNVLHDLFTQAKKNYVLENVSRHDLYLNLNAVEFEESLALICKLCELTYEVQNGIYTLRKSARSAGKAPTSPAPGKPTPENPKTAAKPVVPVTNSNPPTTVTKPEATRTSVSSLESSNKPGKLPTTVLQKPVTGVFSKQDLRSIVETLGKSTGVKVEVDASVPKYKLDITLGKTSLGWALNALAQRLQLQVIFTERQTILLRKA